MQTHLLTHWITDRQMNAICWTLLHSLWIGLIIAALAGLVIICTRRAAPALRYQLFCGLLAVFVSATAFTYLYELGSRDIQAPITASDFHVLTVQTFAAQVQGSNFLQRFSNFFNRQSGFICALWFICFAVQSIKLSGSLLYIRRIRHQGIHKVDHYWQQVTDQFCNRLGIEKNVELIQSELVKIPVTIGLLKPVILLPAGMLLQLLPGQAEAVIWHELAHIRRRDYLVNILQSAIEAAFFFNPAVLWLSALIREEREACCDDIVLVNVQEKSNYLEALLAFQQQQPIPGFAMAMHLNKSKLIDRLRRMVNKENKRLNGTEKIILLGGMMLLSAFTFVPKVSPGVKKGLTEAKHAIAVFIKPAGQPQAAYADTVRQITRVRFRHTNADRLNCEMDLTDAIGNHYYIKLANGKITTLTINDKAVPEQDFGRYQSLVVTVNKRIDDKRRHELQQREQMMTKRAIAVKKHLPIDSLSTLNHVGKKTKSDLVNMSTELNHPGKKLRTDELNIPNSKQEKAKKHERLAMTDEQTGYDKAKAIIAILVSEKVVGDASEIEWYALSNDRLIVNGKRQPEELHQKLVAQFDIQPQFGIYYGPSQVNGSGLIFDSKDIQRMSR